MIYVRSADVYHVKLAVLKQFVLALAYRRDRVKLREFSGVFGRFCRNSGYSHLKRQIAIEIRKILNGEGVGPAHRADAEKSYLYFTHFRYPYYLF